MPLRVRLLAAALSLLPGALTPLAPAAQAPGPPPLSQHGRGALARLQQSDLPGAIATLEEAAGEATPADLALLGTLYLEAGRPGRALQVLGPLAEAEGADAAVLFNAGRAALRLGQQGAAASYFERSLALAPDSPAGRELGLLRGGHGETVEAYRLLRPWALAHPDDVEARVAAAAAALILERPLEAEPLLQGLPEENPRIALLRGQLLLEKGDPPAALAIFEPLLATSPPEIAGDLRRLAADAYIDVGRSAEAVRLLAGSADDPRAALLLAEAQHRTGQAAAAVATLEPFARGILEGPPQAPAELVPQLALDLGRMLAAAGRPAEALPYLEHVTRLDPENSVAWKSLGDALVAAGRRDDAVQALQRFRELAASDTERRRRAEIAANDPVGRSLMEAQRAIGRGASDDALRILRQEAVLSPGDPRPRLAEVRVLLALARHDEALAAAEAALVAFPDLPDAIYQRGLAHLARGETEAGERDLRRALALAPDHTAAMNDLAVLLLTRGEREEARRLLERVLELRPDDALAAQNLERLRAKDSR